MEGEYDKSEDHYNDAIKLLREIIPSLVDPSRITKEKQNMTNLTRCLKVVTQMPMSASALAAKQEREAEEAAAAAELAAKLGMEAAAAEAQRMESQELLRLEGRWIPGYDETLPMTLAYVKLGCALDLDK